MKSLQFLMTLARKAKRTRRGTVAVMAAVATPIVIGFTGLGVEVSTWHANKRMLQTAADAAATSAAIERAKGGNAGAIRTAALREAGRNGYESQNPYEYAINSPPTTGAFTGDPAAVEVVLTRRQTPLLSKFFLNAPVALSARSVASMRTGGPSGAACVLALNPNESGAITNTGSTTINMPGCVLAANSTSSTSIVVTGNANLTAQSLYTAGNYSRGGSSTMTLAQTPRISAAPLPDPFAGTPIPNPGTCTHNSKRIDKATVTLNPGTYCLGIAIGAQSKVAFNPGVYILNRGDFAVNGQAEVTCNCTGDQGVTIILTSSTNASSVGSVVINGGAKVELKAPSDAGNPYRGMLFIQDPRKDDCGNADISRFNGGANMKLTGALYFPHEEVNWSGNNATTACIEIVALDVKFVGNAYLDVSGCPAAGVRQIPIAGATTVSRVVE
ncbi:MAG: hypothetical protein JNK67_05475 [Alphaproteobacteria bacterium]|nr:hypothetical protein [Alphaproteobacteria bacterium]